MPDNATYFDDQDYSYDDETFHAECLEDHLNNPEPEDWACIDYDGIGGDYLDHVGLRD